MKLSTKLYPSGWFTASHPKTGEELSFMTSKATRGLLKLGDPPSNGEKAIESELDTAKLTKDGLAILNAYKSLWTLPKVIGYDDAPKLEGSEHTF